MLLQCQICCYGNKLFESSQTSFVAHSNVSYRVSHRGPCIEICNVSCENVSLKPYSLETKGLFTWYQNEFHSGMSFVPEWSSYCIHMTKSTGSAILKTIRMRHSLQTTRLAVSSRNGVHFQFTWYQNEMSYQNENFIRIENLNELIPEWLVRERNFVLVSCKQIQRNRWGWNELIVEWKSFRHHVNGP